MALSDPRPNPPAHVIRASIEGTNDGVNWANVFWIRNGNASTPGLSDLNTLSSDLLAQYQTHFKAHIGAGVLINECQILYYGPAGADIGGFFNNPQAGTASGSAIPGSTATCISWHVQQRYKGGHPRTYLPSPSHSEIASGKSFSGAHIAAVTDGANDFHRDVNANVAGEASDLHLGTVSFQHQKDWRNPPVFRDYTLESASVDQRIDTQRRRLGRDIL